MNSLRKLSTVCNEFSDNIKLFVINFVITLTILFGMNSLILLNTHWSEFSGNIKHFIWNELSDIIKHCLE